MLEWLDRAIIKTTAAAANNPLVMLGLFAVLLAVVLASPQTEEE